MAVLLNKFVGIIVIALSGCFWSLQAGYGAINEGYLCRSQQLISEADTSKYLQAVEEFAQNVLQNGRDTYGDEHSPLFADGIHIRTGEPVRWEAENESWIISNFGSQQNLMRVLVGLSGLTGNYKYRKAAAEAVEYMYEHQSDSSGLLYWGGHQFVDLQTMENQFKGRPHELKNNFPFYEFMWKVDSVHTRKMLRAMWNAHILKWSNLDLNRHGEYNMEMNHLWDHEFSQPPSFFPGDGLTFINAGTDMIQAALTLYALGDEEGAKKWGVRLYHQYVKARNPETRLGVYQYSKPEQKELPPEDGPLTGELTFSNYGDRAKNQFSKVYGDVALEGNVLWGSRMQTLYGKSPVMILHLAEQLEQTETGDTLLKWTLEGLRAYIDHAYVPSENHFKPMWADGTDLSGHTLPRTGYYGEKGTPFKPVKPSGEMLLAVAKAVRMSDGDKVLWRGMRHLFLGEQLGDPGADLKAEPELNFDTEVADAGMLVTVLEMYKATKNPQYLKLAEIIGENILKYKFHQGYFIISDRHKYVRFDIPEPLALLMLEEVLQGKSGLVPPYLTGFGSTDGEPQKNGRPSDEETYDETFD
ncbi:pectate lyase [Gracilimonas sp.]|uniref:pectate lyase n=1 Tax=Gracilimonas sp. TaxID=1974203 RepID=UPI003BA9A9A7